MNRIMHHFYLLNSKKAAEILNLLSKDDNKQIYLLRKLNNPYIITHLDYINFKVLPQNTENAS